MRILFITQWFQPEPLFKGISFIKGLMEKGHQVQVLTGFPNYPRGSLYPGYKIKFFQKEQMDGIDVVRVPLYPSHDSSAINRMVNYLSFATSTALLGPWLTKKPDVIYVYNPPPPLYWAAFICKLRYRVPLVYDIQDFWPDTLVATGMFHSQFGLKIIDANCRLFYKAANKIVVLSPGFKKKLIQKGVPEHKIEIVYNWFDEKNLTAKCNHIELPEIMTHKEYFKILFAGNMGKAQALDSVLQAAALLKEKSSKIQFIFIGGGVEVDHLKKHVQENNLFNVHFLPPQPFEKIGPILDAADVLLVHLKKEPLFEITIPSKIQAYLAAGKPILSAVAGDASDLIVNAKAGLTCPSEDSSRLAERALEFSRMTPAQLEEMGRNGQNYYKKKLSMQVGIERFDRIFNELG